MRKIILGLVAAAAIATPLAVARTAIAAPAPGTRQDDRQRGVERGPQLRRPRHRHRDHHVQRQRQDRSSRWRDRQARR